MNEQNNWADWASWTRANDDPRIAHSRPEALDDITVLDLSYKSFAGCYCSSLLAEFGAGVIRIEPPGGDFIRTCTPVGLLYKGEGLNYLTEGRNKLHVTLDLEKTAGQEMLRKLAGQADVLIETYRPGIMDGWGVGYEQLKQVNPRLVYASITPFGQFGPRSRSRQPDYDNIIQARSGVQYTTGEMLPEGKTYDDCPWAVPTRAGPWIGWCTAGTFMATSILAALHWRGAGGEGQALDVATDEAYAFFDLYTHIWYEKSGYLAERFGNLDTGLWFYCFAPTKNGGVFLGALRLEMWQAFADMMGKWDAWGAAKWTTMVPFHREEEQLKWSALIFEETRKYTSQELEQMALAYCKTGRLAPITPVVSPIMTPLDTVNDSNWRERGIFTPVVDPFYGEIIAAQAQNKMTETPLRTKWLCRPAGYDNDFVYANYLGLGPAKLKQLKKQGVI